MYTQALIDDVLETHEAVDIYVGTSMSLRSNMLKVAQRVADRVWYRWAWTMKQATGSVSLTSGIGYLPSGFHSVGPNGSVYRAVNEPMRPRPLQEIYILQRQSAAPGRSKVYAVGPSSNVAGAFKRALHCYPLETASVSIVYERTSPTLDDTGGATDGLLEWPDSFYQVLYEGVVWRRMMATGNTGQALQMQLFRDLLRDQIVSEMQGRETSHHMQPYPGRNL